MSNSVNDLENEKIVLSPLRHTWILDLDGTLLKHNGHLSSVGDELLPYTKEFIDSIPEDDVVVILTSREEKYRGATIDFLNCRGIRFDSILFNMPVGERILINDMKPSGLHMSHAINLKRDEGPLIEIEIDTNL